MSIINVQEMTPQIYTEESRDFQLLSRLYDCVFNGMKFDTDSIVELIDTQQCRTSVLQLLQTKLGFFTEKKIDDEKLRKVLECFPILVKNKGSLKAIKETLYLFLRMYSVSSDLEVYYLKTPYSEPFSEAMPCVLANGKFPENNSLVVKIHSFSTKPDITVLEEIFRYILPAGINYYIEFDKNVELPDIVLYNVDSAELIFVSDNLNAEVRGTPQGMSNAETKYRVGAANTAPVISTTSYNSPRFAGYYTKLEDAENYINTLTEKLYTVAIVNDNLGKGAPVIVTGVDAEDGYLHFGRIEFKGTVPSIPRSRRNSRKKTVALKLQEGISQVPLVYCEGKYYLQLNGVWEECNFARYILQAYGLEDPDRRTK